MNPTVLQLAYRALQNKHTTGAAAVYAAAKWGCPLLATWWPSHKAQLEASANILEGAAVFYGFAAAGDASKSEASHNQSQQQIAELQLRTNIIPNAIETGDTEQLRQVPITPASVPPPVVPPLPPVAITLPKP